MTGRLVVVEVVMVVVVLLVSAGCREMKGRLILRFLFLSLGLLSGRCGSESSSSLGFLVVASPLW